MADNSVVISVEVDASGVAKGVEVVQQEVAKTEEKAKSLKAQMKALRDELGKVPEGSKDWQRLTGEIGKLKDKMDAMGESVKTVTGEPLERLNSSFSLVGSSLSSLDFGAAVTGLQGTANAIRGVKFGDLTEATKGFGKTMLDLGKAIMGNPLFAIGAIIVGIITNFETLASAGGKIGAIFTKIGDVFTFLKDQVVAFLDWTTLTDSKAAQMAKDAEARNKRMVEDLKKSNDAIKAMEDSAAKDKMTARQKELYDIKKWFDEQLWLARGNAENQEKVKQLYRERVAQINSKYDDEERKKNEEEYKKRKDLADKEAKEAAERSEKAQQEISDIIDAWDAEDAEKAKKQAELLKQIELEKQNEIEALTQEIQNAKQGVEATEIQNLRDSYFEKIQLAKQNGLDAAVLEEELKKKEEEIRNKYAVKEVELVKMTTEQKLQLAQMSLGSLSSLADALTANGVLNAKQSFKVNKALQLAQAGIGAVQAVQVALADPTLVGPSRYIAAAAAGIAGAANVAKIAAMKFNPGTSTTPNTNTNLGGGAMGAGGGSTAAPALDLSFLNNAQTKAQPIQSYVLATNVTSAQDAQQKILDQSKLIK